MEVWETWEVEGRVVRGFISISGDVECSGWVTELLMNELLDCCEEVVESSDYMRVDMSKIGNKEEALELGNCIKGKTSSLKTTSLLIVNSS